MISTFQRRIHIFFFLLMLIAVSALADDAAAAVGHWRFDMAGLSTGDLYLQADGRFRWVMTKTGDAKPFADSGGTYKLVDGVLELYYDDRPDKPQKWRYAVTADTFTVGAMNSPEKMDYKRVSEKK